jgi:hypothetical protein
MFLRFKESDPLIFPYERPIKESDPLIASVGAQDAGGVHAGGAEGGEE